MSTAMKASKEKGILIFLTEEELKDKFTHYRKADGRFAWWETDKFPKRLEGLTEFPLYVAIEGKVKGFFMVHETYPLPDEEGYSLAYYPESWTPIKQGERVKQRKGWQYYQ
jgi:hypothetical protein